jgi:hypothetical protein
MAMAPISWETPRKTGLVRSVAGATDRWSLSDGDCVAMDRMVSPLG